MLYVLSPQEKVGGPAFRHSIVLWMRGEPAFSRLSLWPHQHPSPSLQSVRACQHTGGQGLYFLLEVTTSIIICSCLDKCLTPAFQRFWIFRKHRAVVHLSIPTIVLKDECRTHTRAYITRTLNVKVLYSLPLRWNFFHPPRGGTFLEP